MTIHSKRQEMIVQNINMPIKSSIIYIVVEKYEENIKFNDPEISSI